MDWNTQVLLECRVYGRQTSDMHAFLEEVKADVLDKYPAFMTEEKDIDYLPLLPSDIEEATNRGLMIVVSNSRTHSVGLTHHALVFTYKFVMSCQGFEEAEVICEDIEKSMPGKFTSIRIARDAWLDRSPH